MSAVGDIYQVSARGTVFGQRILFTTNYIITAQDASVPDNILSTALALAVSDFPVTGSDLLESVYLALLPPEYTLAAWRAQKVDPLRQAYREAAVNNAGTHANSTETANQAAVITLRTDTAGRSQIASKHIGPIPQDVAVQDSGLLTVAYKGLMEDFASALLQTIALAPGGTNVELFPCIHHVGGAPASSPLTNYVIGDTVRVMRRRTVRVGE